MVESTHYFAKIGDVLLLQWLLVPTAQIFLDAFPTIRAEVKKAPNQLHLVIVVPESTGAPDQAARNKGNEITKELAPQLASMHMVMCGNSVVASLTRTVARTMILAIGLRDRVFFHQKLSEAITKIQSLAPGAVPSVGSFLQQASELRFTVA